MTSNQIADLLIAAAANSADGSGQALQAGADEIHRLEGEVISLLAAHDRRATELLEANNRYQQEARDARAACRAVAAPGDTVSAAASDVIAERRQQIEVGGYQSRVDAWMQACFGATIAADTTERNHRFLEEALELVQSLGGTASEAHQLVDYVFGRPAGAPHQEVGGVMVTLAALCTAAGLDGHAAAEDELDRVWTKIDQIRAKQAAKPKHSPLPQRVEAAVPSNPVIAKLRDAAFVVEQQTKVRDSLRAEIARLQAEINLATSLAGLPYVSRAVVSVLAERRRQIEVEGYTPAHDDAHDKGELAGAAAAYAAYRSQVGITQGSFQARRFAMELWPWPGEGSYKPKTRYDDLKRAAAFLIAEMDRLNRLATHTKAEA